MKWETYVTREALSAPHYLALRYVMEQSQSNCDKNVAIDFGARTSILPALLACGRAFKVFAVDRDPAVMTSQPVKLAGDVSCAGRVSPVMIPSVDILAEYAEKYRGEIDLVTAVWSIQHNSIDDQRAIAQSLAKLLAPGGSRMIVVSSMTRAKTYRQENRADPQTVLSLPDILSTIVIPSGLRLSDARFFWYDHATTNGDYCSYDDPDPSHPNAIAYTLTKD